MTKTTQTHHTTFGLIAGLMLTAALSATPALANDGFPATSQPLPATSGLILKVEGLDGDEGGELLIGLYDSEDGFESETDILGKTIPVDAAVETVTFTDLLSGDYAVKVFHDEDSDGKLDTTLGIPSEPYGFSNNASDPFSAPEWDETKFTVSGNSEVHTIDLD